MSKAKALFKRLRTKAIEEREKEEKERNESPENNHIQKFESCPIDQKQNNLSIPKLLIPLKEEKEEEIDPLDYFKTEHIKIEPSDMKEYEIFEEKKESNEDKTNISKENKENKEIKKENEIVIDIKTGVMGPTSHKINFREMMKARNKIKKNDKVEIEDVKKQNRKNMSVEPRKIKKKQEEEINKEDEEKEKEKKDKRIKVKSVEKNSEDNTQSLYVKLILARNRLSSKNVVTEENVFQNILDLIEEFKSIKDLPQELTDEINNLLKKLEFPKHLIIDDDVQDYIPEDKFVPLIENSIPLDEVIRKLKITEN